MHAGERATARATAPLRLFSAGPLHRQRQLPVQRAACLQLAGAGWHRHVCLPGLPLLQCVASLRTGMAGRQWQGLQRQAAPPAAGCGTHTDGIPFGRHQGSSGAARLPGASVEEDVGGGGRPPVAPPHRLHRPKDGLQAHLQRKGRAGRVSCCSEPAVECRLAAAPSQLAVDRARLLLCSCEAAAAVVSSPGACRVGPTGLRQRRSGGGCSIEWQACGGSSRSRQAAGELQGSRGDGRAQTPSGRCQQEGPASPATSGCHPPYLLQQASHNVHVSRRQRRLDHLACRGRQAWGRQASGAGVAGRQSSRERRGPAERTQACPALRESPAEKAALGHTCQVERQL